MSEVKYFRVRTNTPLWKEGAIISNQDEDHRDEYHAITDVWDNTELDGEYLTDHIVINQPDWFEEVKPVLGANNELTFTKI